VVLFYTTLYFAYVENLSNLAFMSNNSRIKNGGFGFCTSDVMRNPLIPLRDKAIYAYLCTFADSQTNQLVVGVNTISSELNIAPITVTRSLKLLEKLKIISRINRGNRKTKITIILK
jgi:hypothetical protein